MGKMKMHLAWGPRVKDETTFFGDELLWHVPFIELVFLTYWRWRTAGSRDQLAPVALEEENHSTSTVAYSRKTAWDITHGDDHVQTTRSVPKRCVMSTAGLSPPSIFSGYDAVRSRDLHRRMALTSDGKPNPCLILLTSSLIFSRKNCIVLRSFRLGLAIS